MNTTPVITPAAMNAREQLYSAFGSAVFDVDDDVTEVRLNAYLDRHIKGNPHLASLAECAGGRWHVVGGVMAFVPW